MELTQIRLFRGDIVDLVEMPPSDEKKINNIRKALLSIQPYKLVVLRPLDDGLYLVVVCKELQNKSQMVVDTNEGPLHIRVMNFYSIDRSSLQLCNDLYFKKNKSQVVDEIYALHNDLQKKCRAEKAGKARIRREAAKKKNALKAKAREAANKERIEKKKERKRLEDAYDIAIINNDTKRMQEIKDILGYTPCRRGFGGKSGKKNSKVPYSTFNPRPCSGGRFTPK